MAKNAFLVIDMQKDFNEEGAPLRVENGLKTIPYIQEALEATRGSNVPIFHVFRYYRSDGSDVELTRYDTFKNKGGTEIATHGAEIVDGIEPKEGEYQIVKQRWSAFFNTELDLILRRLGVKQVVLTGVQTPNCIRGTAWDANSLDYDTIVLTDATGAATDEVHEANLFDMENIGVKLMTTEEYVQSLKEDPDGPEAEAHTRISEEVNNSEKNPEPVDMYDYSDKY